MNEQTVLNKEGVEARHHVALLPIGVLVLIGGFVMRRPIVVAFEPFGVLGGRLAEGEQLHPFGQLHLAGRGHHHVVDHVERARWAGAEQCNRGRRRGAARRACG